MIFFTTMTYMCLSDAINTHNHIYYLTGYSFLTKNSFLILLWLYEESHPYAYKRTKVGKNTNKPFLIVSGFGERLDISSSCDETRLIFLWLVTKLVFIGELFVLPSEPTGATALLCCISSYK